jgi:hypothetical protein
MQMENLPFYISAVFMLITALTVYLFYKATSRSKAFLLIVLFWLIVQTVLSLNSFYTITYTLPPRFVLLIAPPVLLLAVLFLTAPGKRFIDGLSLQYLTLLHVIRIPVELVLFWLMLHKAIPQLMTFEGSNFDILSGLTAPVVYYIFFIKKQRSQKLLLVWNVICLLLLFNIVIRAILAAPSPFQQLAFAQPNIAILYFPFVWLPGCIVPLVLFSHIVAIRKILLAERRTTANAADTQEAHENALSLQ